LEELSDEELQTIDPHLGPAIKSRMTLSAAIAGRKGTGGTAPEQVSTQLQRLSERISLQRRWATGKAKPRD
jgi:argininosuccinate lyase